MAHESGDMKLLGNFRKLIDFISAETNYNPTNPLLATTALETLYTDALAAVNDIPVKLAPNKVAINERQIAFDELPALVRRSRNVLKASGASPELISDAETYVRKITGKRKTPKVVDNPDAPEAEASVSISASQLSFENQLGNFRSLNQILMNEPLYSPNEDELKTGKFTNLANNLEVQNNAVRASFVPLSNSRAARDGQLYNGENSVLNVARQVKDYVKGALGTDSNLYRQIKGLKFRTQSK